VECVGASDFDRTVQRFRKRRLGDRRRDIVCGHWLEKRVRQAHSVAFNSRLRDAAQELEELGGSDDRVWNWRALDEPFLGKFGAHIAAVLYAFGPNNREG